VNFLPANRVFQGPCRVEFSRHLRIGGSERKVRFRICNNRCAAKVTRSVRTERCRAFLASIQVLLNAFISQQRVSDCCDVDFPG
jgi:hypothetical protein